MVEKITKIFDEVSANEEVELKIDNNSEVFVVQIQGTATAFSFLLEGKIRREDESYESIAAINTKNFAVNTVVNENGVYNYSVVGISSLKFTISGVSGGTITVIGENIK